MKCLGIDLTKAIPNKGTELVWWKLHNTDGRNQWRFKQTERCK